jgi:sulfide:quinone oxidoreductase
MKTGKLAIITADMPIKCPVAPLEFAFLADYFFHRRGIRDQVDITYITPLSGAFTQPNASRILQSLIDKKRITIVPNFTMEHIDAADKTVFSFEGDSVDYDLLCVVPPHLGPQVIEDSGLGDGSGYGVADRRTLKSRKADFIYFIGDNSNVTHFKTGSVAHFQARTVVDNLLREIEGKKPLASFDGHANCFMETGYEKAVLIDFNYDMEPLEGTFPLPLVGPFSLLEESYINHVGDIVFKWVYWNMLLSGCMPMVPLVPSQMDFIGKDLTQAPQLRRARALKVKDVMSKDVVTVTQGTPLTEAAQLMSRHNVSGLPVVDVDDQLIGVLTEADFLSAIDIKGDSGIKQIFDAIIKRKRTKKKMGTIVDDIMTRDPITVKEEDTLQHAIEVMGMNQIKRLIVTHNEGNICGVISRPDLIKLFLMRG